MITKTRILLPSTSPRHNKMVCWDCCLSNSLKQVYLKSSPHPRRSKTMQTTVGHVTLWTELSVIQDNRNPAGMFTSQEEKIHLYGCCLDKMQFSAHWCRHPFVETTHFLVSLTYFRRRQGYTESHHWWGMERSRSIIQTPSWKFLMCACVFNASKKQMKVYIYYL